MSTELFRDSFGVLTHDSERSRLDLVWLDGSAEMSDDDFKAHLSRLAEAGEMHRAKHVVVDVRAFRHQPGPGIMGWRDAEIIPRYNRAGIEKFAFLLPSGAPERPAAPEGPAEFPTGWFNRETSMDAWFASA